VNGERHRSSADASLLQGHSAHLGDDVDSPSTCTTQTPKAPNPWTCAINCGYMLQPASASASARADEVELHLIDADARGPAVKAARSAAVPHTIAARPLLSRHPGTRTLPDPDPVGDPGAAPARAVIPGSPTDTD